MAIYNYRTTVQNELYTVCRTVPLLDSVCSMVLFLPEFPGGEYKVLGQILLLVPNKIIKLHSWGNFIEMQPCKCHGGTGGKSAQQQPTSTAEEADISAGNSNSWPRYTAEAQTRQLATATVGQDIQLKRRHDSWQQQQLAKTYSCSPDTTAATSNSWPRNR